MEGIKRISMLFIVSVMLDLVIAHDQDEAFEEADWSSMNFLPDQTASLPAETLIPPGTPWPPGIPLFTGNHFTVDTPVAAQLDCEDKCALKCSKLMPPLATNICLQVCEMRCRLLHLEFLYDCTFNCAESMPVGLMSHREKTESYVNSCYKKCMKNNN